jgi:hypothetical protein
MAGGRRDCFGELPRFLVSFNIGWRADESPNRESCHLSSAWTTGTLWSLLSRSRGMSRKLWALGSNWLSTVPRRRILLQSISVRNHHIDTDLHTNARRLPFSCGRRKSDCHSLTFVPHVLGHEASFARSTAFEVHTNHGVAV